MASRKKSPTKPDPFPFPFLAHGTWSANDYRQSAEWLVIFEFAVAASKQRSILDSVVAPLEVSSWSGDRVLTLSTGQDAGVGIWNVYSGQEPLSDEAMEQGGFEDVKITAVHIKSFCDDVDQWLLKLHESEPIGLVVGCTERRDKWHRWSVRQFPDRLLPLFEGFFQLARPPSEIPREPESVESGMAYALMDAVKNYFSTTELSDCAPDLIARLQALFDRATGYNGLANRSIIYMRRCIEEEVRGQMHQSFVDPMSN